METVEKTINTRRVMLGGLAGGVVWSIWTIAVNLGILMSKYTAAGQAGLILQQPRYSLFVAYWIITMFLLSYVVAWLYASARATRGAGPGTALKIGLLVGFAAGFPMNLTLAAWSPVGRVLPLWWMIDLWVGAVLASLVAGWVYKD
ncbi:MAG TPA: hypothetical protein VG204_02760 [Terriglobia bacterium]|nr:hypothetical protein [Terriglobia bacterium]